MPHVMNISYTDAVINILVMKKRLIYCSIVLVCKFADNLLFWGVKPIVLGDHMYDIRLSDWLQTDIAPLTTYPVMHSNLLSLLLSTIAGRKFWISIFH